MTEAEAAKKANETARKIVGDYVVSICGFPSMSTYDRMNGGDLVKTVEKALLDMYSSGVHDGINEG